MIYGYIRVSTDKQTVENQRFEINNFCKKQNIIIDGWIEETISGTKSFKKRELGKLIAHVQRGDRIICSEISRIGRTILMIMEFLSICMEKGIELWTVKEGYKLGDDIQSKVLAFAFGLSAEIERNLISQRTKEALARKKAEGVKLGRKKGSQNPHIAEVEIKIIEQYENGILSTQQIAFFNGVSRGSVTKIAKKYGVTRKSK